MRLQDNIDFTTLTWVKPELDETLKQARNALQNYVEEGENPSELKTCSELLHQVQGTLRMVELYGAAMVAEEMEQLAKALIDSKVSNRETGYASLMQGIIQLPDYLERLQSGHRDIPIVLLPLLNLLRESRGEKGLNESVLFSPDLSRPLPASAHGPQLPLEPAELARRAEALRGLFQGALLRWLKDDNSPATIKDLADVCDQLVPITWSEPARRLFWVAAGVLEALGRGSFPSSTPLKQVIAKVEREIKRLVDGGDAAFRANPPLDLTKQLLYFIAQEGSDTGRIGEIRAAFGLSNAEPSEAELAHARGSLAGSNRALLETVAVAIKEDLLRVKDALDLHLRTPGASLAELSTQVEALDRVADTLGMLGLGVPRRVVQDQRTAINDVVSGQRQGNEETLLDIAGALLYVEAALDEQVERLGKDDAAAPADGAGAVAALAPATDRKLLEVLVKEAIVNFGGARQAFVAFVETHWDHAQLAEVPRLLTEVSGALRILNLTEPGDYLIAIRQFTDKELLHRKQVPNGQQMDRLADALASIEYFLEALRDRRPNREQILEVARQSLEGLGYWPLTDEMRSVPVTPPQPVAAKAEPEAAAAPAAVEVSPAPAAPAPVEVASAPAAAASAAPIAAIAPAAPLAAAAAPVAAAVSALGALVPGFDGSSSEEIDDEIREVFLEEFEEEIANLAQLLPPWSAEPANAELLRPIRRVFHTLKGSGRLVGAKALGEFSWKVESLLNRVLDGSRPASPQVLSMVQLALDQLPTLRAALQGDAAYADLAGIEAVAERLAAGEEATYVAASVAAPAAEVAVESEPMAAPAPEPEIEAAAAPVEAVEEAETGHVFSIDPVLLEILKPEVAGHLETVDAWLAACVARGPQQVTDPLLRSIHTMNGAFAMTELGVITDVTAPLEGYVKRALASHLVPSSEGVRVVEDAAAAIRSTILAIEKPRPVLPQFEELSARVQALRDSLPDALASSMPTAIEEDAVMPQVIELEADLSAIPQFDTAESDADITRKREATEREAAEAAQAAEAQAALEAAQAAEAQAALEAAQAAEAQAARDAAQAAEAQAALEAAQAAEAQAALEAAQAEFAAAQAAEAQAAFEAAQAAEAQAALAAAQAAEAQVAFEAAQAAEAQAALEAAQAAEAQAAFDAAQAAEAQAAFEAAQAEFEAHQAAEAQAAFDAAKAAEAQAAFDDARSVEAQAASFEPIEFEAVDGDFQLEESIASSTQGEVAELAQAQFEHEPAAMDASAAATDETLELAAAHDAAPSLEQLPAASEIEATPTLDEEEPEEPVVAHAELPESEILSLEVFLRQGIAAPAFEMDEAPEAEDEAPAAAEQAPAFSIDESEPPSHAFQIDEQAPAFEEARSFDTPEALAVLDMPPEPAAPEIEEAVETGHEHEFAMEAGAEQASEIEQAPEAEDSAATREAAEAAAALAGMIAAYPGEAPEAEAPEAEAPEAEVPEAEVPEAEVPEPDALAEAAAGSDAGDSVFSAEELAGAADLMDDGGFATEAERAPELPAEAEAGPAATEVALSDDFYGLSEAELEALTAPGETETSAPIEADGFADLPSISELPAWASSPAVQAVESETAPAAQESELEPISELLADPEVFAEPEPVAEAEPEPVAEAAPAEPEPEVEPQPEVVPEAEPEVAEEAEEFQDEVEPEPIAAVAVAAEPEPVAQLARPAVPMAKDEEDPEQDLDTTDLDTELLDLFLEETSDILDHSDGMLARLREHIEDRETIVNLQRDLHTLKGGARMAGIYAVGELGHAMESLLEAVAEGRLKLDATGVVVLERGFDRLHGMVGRIGSRKAIAVPTGLIAQVEALSEGRSLDSLESVEVEAAAPAAAQSVEAAAPAPKPAAPVAQRPLSAPVEDVGGDEELSSVRAPQEQVRIRADLLDRLVNYAGEVAIYRARLEQQLGAFRANLGELDQTTTRLREQLRRLDIETEAQIVARYQREGESDDERFDPLELDRFTNQQQLTRALNESANDLVNLQGVLDELVRQYETLLLQQSRVSSDLQEGLMRTRMVPFDALVPRLRRVLRQAAIDTGKQVQLKVDGASGEMDRNVLDRMTAPLEHMLRNSMAHGLESPEDRRKAKKGEEGTVRIAVLREGSEVVLKVSDDGRGLNKEAIRRKATEKGLIPPDAELSDEAIYALILEGGFSTAETVTRLSGRGVGMDVVYSEIRQLGGTLQIKSDPGKGSEFTIRLPFTLAVTQAVFVKIGDTNFAVPIASVRGVGRISRADLDKQLASDTPVFTYAGEDYAIHDLGTLIGHATAKAQDSLQMPLLLARSGDLRTAISIDQVLGSREIVVKPVGPQVNSVPGIFGATIMGDGRVVVILDVAPLVRRHVTLLATAHERAPVVPAPVVAAKRIPVVMVVDDSITMRKVTGRVLERNNMEVLTAKDGVDAVEKMAERVPDLVLLDIEMPRMDGYEVAQNMKSDPRLKDVPIIMITSRTGDKHRQRAMDIGVDRYLGKPYQELELMRNVFDVLGMEAVSD